MGKRVIITAGGTAEPIDGVRNITNMSTGRLGSEICTELINQKGEQIEKIYYICPFNAIQPSGAKNVEIVHITGTQSLKETVENIMGKEKIDYFIHSMAVSDYTTDYVSNASNLAEEIAQIVSGNKDLDKEAMQNLIEKVIRNHSKIIDRSTKISSSQDNLIIKLKQTPKIISMIKDLQPETVLVGFKLLNEVPEEELHQVAYKLLQKNKCDLVLANDLKKIREGTHTGFVIYPDNKKEVFYGKSEIAKNLVRIMWDIGQN